MATRPLLLLFRLVLLWAASCAPLEERRPSGRATPTEVGEEGWQARREALVGLLRQRGVRDPSVLAAIGRVPRHRFVPPEVQGRAYDDVALPIGLEQTISQPYVVATMTAAARLAPGANVLEVGTGSGYQAAILAEVLGLGPGSGERTPRGRLASIEILDPLARRAAATLAALGYREVAVRTGDGYRGWPERAPFDAILVTAAPDHVPKPLRAQLAPGGRLVIPVGDEAQELLVVTRTGGGFTEERLFGVRFVPMRGEAESRR